jgi:hypothetical protein
VQLVKTILYIQFATAISPFLGLRDLLRIASGNPTVELQGQPIIVDRQNLKERVVLAVRALTLEQEGDNPLEERLVRALEVLRLAQEVLPFPTINKVRYDSMSIEPYALPFHELVALMKNRFFRQGPIVEVATDVGMTFDQHDGEVVKHTQFGPMESAQLRTTFLRWQPEKLPDCFAFLNLGYERNLEMQFNPQNLQEFFNAAIRWQASQAKDILAALGQDGG